MDSEERELIAKKKMKIMIIAQFCLLVSWIVSSVVRSESAVVVESTMIIASDECVTQCWRKWGKCKVPTSAPPPCTTAESNSAEEEWPHK